MMNVDSYVQLSLKLSPY